MGNASSIESTKTIYLDISGKSEKITFSRFCGPRDIQDLITQAAGVNRSSNVSIRDANGALIPLSGNMPRNTGSTPYEVHITESRTLDTSDEGIVSVLTQVADQFNKVLKMDELRSDICTRLSTLERRIELEGLKAVEIEKCKRDISDIKEHMWNAQRKMVDYNSMRSSTATGMLASLDSIQPRPVIYGNAFDHFYSSMSDERKISLKRDVPAYPKYTLSQETIDYLKQPTFDIWHWEPNEMLSLLEHMYHELGLVSEFNINPITLKRWLLCVQENYRNNPFHNFRHCFCVTQMMYGMIHLCRLWERMPREDLGVLLTACVSHDLDHPGYNNTYQINARTELAIRYNDISPLENHHCAVAFKILSNPECNIFSNVDKDTYKRIRAGMLTLILATDMARHKEILEGFKECLDKFDFKNENHKNALKMVLIKCCDISNEVRPTEVSDPWVDCLLEEYFNQSDREKMEGLPVAPFMDRDKVTKPTAQIGFIKFVLIPMFETVAQLFPETDATMVEPLRQARDRYESMKDKSPTTNAPPPKKSED